MAKARKRAGMEIHRLRRTPAGEPRRHPRPQRPSAKRQRCGDDYRRKIAGVVPDRFATGGRPRVATQSLRHPPPLISQPRSQPCTTPSKKPSPRWQLPRSLPSSRRRLPATCRTSRATPSPSPTKSSASPTSGTPTTRSCCFWAVRTNSSAPPPASTTTRGTAKFTRASRTCRYSPTAKPSRAKSCLPPAPMRC